MVDMVPFWVELRQLAQEHYPNLPPHEAYPELYHDAFIKFPKELVKVIEPALGPIAKEGDAIAEAVAFISKEPRVMFIVKMFSIVNRMLKDNDQSPPWASQTMIDNLTAEANGDSNQMIVKILERLSLAAADPSNSVSPDNVVREIHGIHVIGNSIIDHINYYGRWMQTVSAIKIAQGQQVIRALNVICDHLRDSNCITVSGSGGPDGFARHVYDFIQKRINDVSQNERDKHRFFIYHPDTNWYGAFHRLIRENPLPPEFSAMADDLDTVCLFMQDVRKLLAEESDRGKDIIFHLLIPSWYSLSIKEPLHFPTALNPLRVEGEKHKGKELVELNLPAAPAGLLNGVANVLDPRNLNKIASGAAVATTLPAVGWGINGACLALGLGVGAVTGLGALIAIPVWFGTAAPAMTAGAPVIGNTVYEALREEAPRVLGSNERLIIAGSHF